jgi:hypothetical protein
VPLVSWETLYVVFMPFTSWSGGIAAFPILTAWLMDHLLAALGDRAATPALAGHRQAWKGLSKTVKAVPAECRWLDTSAPACFTSVKLDPRSLS